MTHRPSTWPSSAADRSASACCSSSCCRCPPAALSLRLYEPQERPGRAAPTRTTCAAIYSTFRPAICRRWPGAWTSWTGCGAGIPPGWPATGGRRDRSGRFPAPAAVRRLHGRRLRAGARAGAKPGVTLEHDARARRRRHAAGQRTRCGYWRNRGSPVWRAAWRCATATCPRAPSRRWQPRRLLQQPLSGQRAGGGHRRRRHGLRDRHQPERGRRRGRAATGRHRGPLICVSRNGRLPSVRSPHNRPPPR